MANQIKKRNGYNTWWFLRVTNRVTNRIRDGGSEHFFYYITSPDYWELKNETYLMHLKNIFVKWILWLPQYLWISKEKKQTFFDWYFILDGDIWIDVLCNEPKYFTYRENES